MKSQGIGDVVVMADVGHEKIEVTLTNVLYIPEAPCHFLSYLQLILKGGRIDTDFSDKSGYLVDSNGERIFRIYVIEGLFVADLVPASNATNLCTLTQLHKIFGHVSKRKIKQMVEVIW